MLVKLPKHPNSVNFELPLTTFSTAVNLEEEIKIKEISEIILAALS